MSDIRISGLSELQKFLDELGPKIQRNVTRNGLRAAAKKVKDAAVAQCPVEEPSSEGRRLYKLYAGALRDSIRVSVRIRRSGFAVAKVIAGGKSKKTGADVFYAHMVEFTGARAHTITAKNRKVLSFGGRLFQSVNHPGMRARPFLRTAFDAKLQEALEAFVASIRKQLSTKYGIDTPDIEVEL